MSYERLEQPHSRRMLFVTGPHAVGKSSVTKASLGEDFSIFDLGPLIRCIHQEQSGGSLSYKDWVQKNETLHGKEFTSEALVRDIGAKLLNRHIGSGIAMVGNRSVSGIEYFKKKFKPLDSRIVYFDAPPEVLVERYRNRENNPDLAEGQFQAMLDSDKELGLEAIRNNADFVICNTGGFDDATLRLREIVDAWKPVDNSPSY